MVNRYFPYKEGDPFCEKCHSENFYRSFFNGEVHYTRCFDCKPLKKGECPSCGAEDISSHQKSTVFKDVPFRSIKQTDSKETGNFICSNFNCYDVYEILDEEKWELEKREEIPNE